MKKQIDPSIKAHLLRSALISVSLLALCLIPFALAQRQMGAPIMNGKPAGLSCTPGWSPAADLPTAGVRFVGVYFPANGKFYVMGGRDANDVEFTHPFEYDPASNTWTTKSASYPDAFTNNMACSVLNFSGTDNIYCVGGSNFTSQTSSGRVFSYNPLTDSIATLAGDWPPGDNNIIPGGFAVHANKLYILGGFNLNTSVTDEIWEFTPFPGNWVQKNAHLPLPRCYIPTTTIGDLIYTGGGDDYQGTLVDTSDSFVYDPVADSISTIASIPRVSSNTRGLNFNGKMWVLGGEFPTPVNEVDIYDPGTNTWSLGPSMLVPRRNFAVDTNGTDHIWAAGGYDDSGVANGTTEVFCQQGGTPTPTATATTTATATSTPTATATFTPRPTPTVRPMPTPRPRPTPAPRP